MFVEGRGEEVTQEDGPDDGEWPDIGMEVEWEWIMEGS